MNRTPTSWWLAGLCCLVGGCQPEPESPAASATTRPRAQVAPVGSWTSTGLKVSSSAAAALLRSTGEVLDPALGVTQRYNPYSNTWVSTTPQCAPGQCTTTAARALPSGDVLTTVILPGRTGGTPAVRLYDVETDAWSFASAPYYREGAVTVLDSGRVLFSGGITTRGVTRVANEYDPEHNTSLPVGDMTVARGGHLATALFSGQVLVVGGTADGDAELYSPTTRTWTAVAPMPRVRTARLAVRLSSGAVLVLGPDAGADVVADIYDPYTARWSPGTPPPLTRPTSATLLHSGEVLVTNDAGQAALYVPAQNAWLPAASAHPSSVGTALLLHTGQVLRLGRDQASAELFTR